MLKTALVMYDPGRHVAVKTEYNSDTNVVNRAFICLRRAQKEALTSSYFLGIQSLKPAFSDI